MSRRQDFLNAPGGRYGQPTTSWPSPVLEDVIVIEDLPLKSEGYKPMLKGTPRPGDPDARLAHESIVTANDNNRSIRRIYATDRVNQDLYNWTLNYAKGSQSHPGFIRSYIIRRDRLEDLPTGEELGTVYRLHVANGGSGYTEPVLVTFSGGGGTGAKAEAILTEAGEIDSIALKSGGSGYTSAPSITLTASTGSGATIVAHIQPPGCKLINEEITPLEDPTLSGLFVRVIRVYQMIPGPPTTGVQIGDDSWAKYAKDALVETTTQTLGYGEIPEEDANTISITTQPGSVHSTDSTALKAPGGFVSLTAYNAIDSAALGGETVTISETAVPGTTPVPAGGFTILDARQIPLNAKQAINTVTRLPEGATTFPLLYGTDVDTTTGIMVNMTKTLVPNGTNGGIVGNKYTEIQPRDAQRAIAITSEILLPLPDPIITPVFVEVALPSRLTGLKVIFNESVGKQQKGSGSGAGASVSTSISAVIVPEYENGFRGGAKGQWEQHFYIGPPPPSAIPDETAILTTSGTAYVMIEQEDHGVSTSTDGLSISSNVSTRTAVTRVNEVLTNGVIMTGNGNLPGGLAHQIMDTATVNPGTESAGASASGITKARAYVDLPASTPVTLVPGSWVIKSVKVRKLPLNLYILDIVKYQVPASTPPVPPAP